MRCREMWENGGIVAPRQKNELLLVLLQFIENIHTECKILIKIDNGDDDNG